MPKALFLIEPCESSVGESAIIEPHSHSGMHCPSLLASSPRPARCGACWPLRERARPLRPISQALQRARAGLPAVLRPPRERLVPRIERHESGAAGSRAERPPSAQPRIASMPPALPRRPKQTRAMLIPFYAADAPPPPPVRLADPQNNVSEAGVPRSSLALGLELCTLRVGAALVSLPLPPFTALKDAQSREKEHLMARLRCAAIREEISRDSGEI